MSDEECEFHSTSKFLCVFYFGLRGFVDFLVGFEVYIAILCMLINSFHILVLTRKSMRASSINLILAFVAISDMYTQFYIIEQKTKNYYENLDTSCNSGTSYISVFIDILLKLLKDFARRSSTWLSFSTALIRTLVIRNPMNPKFEKLSTWKSGIFTVLFIWIIDAGITTFGYFQWTILRQRITNDCNPKHPKIWYYRFDHSLLFIDNDYLIYKIYTDFDAVVSKFIPCVLFPIATVFLIYELRKNDKNRAKMSSSSSTSSAKTTKLVLCLTVTFFIAEFPLAVISALEPYFTDGYGLLLFMYYLNFLFTILLSANTSSHMIICLLMSSQYWLTAKSLICCGSRLSVNKTSTATIRSSSGPI